MNRFLSIRPAVRTLLNPLSASIQRASANGSRMAPAFAARFYSAGGSLSHEDIERRILTLLKDFDKVKKENLSASADFQKDLKLDSLDAVEVVMAIEEEFSVEIPDEEADKITTVAKAVEYISHAEGAH
ncbi:mitochondrial acyl carrier protein [Mycoemilia scoparia]|uniref:Acyl carrier protein n=1 Tax=Mycoemilia scoparia TaxID=417184 RepID=A0A9W7ZY15_9FUNG|nr:mitochondrial acyl carrier protein [Mycoemilia scoparia]